MGFMLEVYASRPWLKSNLMDLMQTPPPCRDRKALDVLCEEIIKNLSDAPQVSNVHLPTACLSVPSLDSIIMQAGEGGTSDDTTMNPHTSHSPCSLGRCSQTQSLSPWHHSQSSWSSSSSSSRSRSGSASGTSSSGSSRSHDQDPVPGLMPAPGHVLMLAVLMHQLTLILHPLKLYRCMAMMMIPPQIGKRIHLIQKMKQICHKVLCHCLIFLPLMMRMLTR